MLEKNLVIDTINENFYQYSSNPKWLETLSVDEHDRVFLIIKDKLIQKDFYSGIDLESMLNLGDVAVKLIKKYPKEIIIEAMIEDSIFRAINGSIESHNIGFSISSLIDGL